MFAWRAVLLLGVATVAGCGVLGGSSDQRDAVQAKLGAAPGVQWDTSPSTLKGSIALVANPAGFSSACRTVKNDLVRADGSVVAETVTVCPDNDGAMVVQDGAPAP